jgi:hypothetical protein
MAEEKEKKSTWEKIRKWVVWGAIAALGLALIL